MNSGQNEYEKLKWKIEQFIYATGRRINFIYNEDPFEKKVKRFFKDIIQADLKPEDGFNLVLLLWKNDNVLIPICHIGDGITEVYMKQGVKAFWHYADALKNSNRVEHVLKELLSSDEYEVRISLLKKV